MQNAEYPERRNFERATLAVLAFRPWAAISGLGELTVNPNDAFCID
jgi:hypothetical protein